jgi:hypothetical protein
VITVLSVCLYVYIPTPRIVASHQFGKHFPAATNNHATKEEFLEASFSVRSVSYQRKIKDKVKISLLQAVEAPRVARGRGSHIT